jgi:holin-like protein
MTMCCDFTRRRSHRIGGLAVPLVFQLAGELLTRLGDLPVPGPVVGMVLLVIALELGLPIRTGLRAASGGLLTHLSLLFVPAGVGIIQHLPRLSREWPALGAALLVSTAATVAVTGWVSSRLTPPSPSPGGEGA